VTELVGELWLRRLVRAQLVDCVCARQDAGQRLAVLAV